jgi:hypothetical protein
MELYDNNSFSIIDDYTCYAPFNNCCVIHNLNEEQAENILKNLEPYCWILRTDTTNSYELNAITMKTDDGFIHHKDFYWNFFSEKDDQILILDKTLTLIDKKLIYKKSYANMGEFLQKLKEIYGLNIDRQVIFEND